MNIEKIPLVTTLLRTARDTDEDLMRVVLHEIIVNSPNDVDINATDRSGRTAISYICSTNLLDILDVLLKIPNIDVNKADNEGNTPLHFAAQAGQADMVNMLLTRSRSINVDAKNHLGFTPLMKAALQGRIRCAKLLLFAGASPIETDSGRGLRAEQWARFCGRYSCAEMIEKLARARLLEKTTSCKWGHDALNLENSKQISGRTISAPLPHTEQNLSNSGLKATIRKVFPFRNYKNKKNKGKEKDVDNEITCNTDIVTYLTAATLCASGPALPQRANKKVLKSLFSPEQLPKLEVTPASNHSLIKKYETKSLGVTNV